jgi:simple sugar transport system ATP-binding protein
MFGDGAAANTGFLDSSRPVTVDVSRVGDSMASPTAAPAADEGAPILELVDVWTRAGAGEVALHGVSLTVRMGEIVGVAGAEGGGQHALAAVIAGQVRPERGDVRVGGKSVAGEGVAARHAVGVSYLSGDRLGEGIVPALSVAFNLFLKRIGRPPQWRRGLVRRREVERTAVEALREFELNVGSPWVACGTLSGGSIQRLMLARELLGAPRVIVFENPTAGLDHKTTVHVRGLVARLVSDEGLAAVVISSDLDEMVEISDRVVVLSKGRIVRSLVRGPGLRAAAAEAMVGAA